LIVREDSKTPPKYNLVVEGLLKVVVKINQEFFKVISDSIIAVIPEPLAKSSMFP
jgi:hypothetical protein